jgi:hypothetical protein
MNRYCPIEIELAANRFMKERGRENKSLRKAFTQELIWIYDLGLQRGKESKQREVAEALGLLLP